MYKNSSSGSQKHRKILYLKPPLNFGVRLRIFWIGTALVCTAFIYCSWSNVSYIPANRYFCYRRKMERFGIALFWYVCIKNPKSYWMFSTYFAFNNWIRGYGPNGGTPVDVRRCCQKWIRCVFTYLSTLGCLTVKFQACSVEPMTP